MVFDPTAWSRAGDTKAGRQGLASVVGGYRVGQEIDAEKQRQSLGDVSLRTREFALEEGMNEADRQEKGRELMLSGFEAYKNQDMGGFQSSMMEAAQFLPKEASETYNMMSTMDRTNTKRAMHHVLAAGKFKPEDTEGIFNQIDAATEIVNPRSPLGIQLQQLKALPPDQLQTGIAATVEWAKLTGSLPGVAASEKDELAWAKLRVQQGNLVTRGKELMNDKDRLQWKKDMFDYERLHGKMPEGFKEDPKNEGEIISIPGSKVWSERKEAKFKLLKEHGDRMSKSERVLRQTKNLIEKADWTTAGLVGTLAKFIPGTDAADFEAVKTSIVANLGFDRLQQMRDASKTGGALGNVSELELQALQASIANLEQTQSPEQLKENLGVVVTRYENILKKSKLDHRDLKKMNVDRMFSTADPESALVGVSKGPNITTQEQYDKLESGDFYMEDGQPYQKP